MKNLVILGVPRAGKTRLSLMVAKSLANHDIVASILPADIIMSCLDKIRRTFFWRFVVRPSRHIFPFVNRISKQRQRKKLRIFTKNYMKQFPAEHVVIFEGVYIKPQDAIKFFDMSKTKIVIIGYPNANIPEKMDAIRKYNRGVSPLIKKTDEELKARVNEYVNISRTYQEFAKKHDITFLDTSTDYHGTINGFAENIIDFLSD